MNVTSDLKRFPFITVVRSLHRVVKKIEVTGWSVNKSMIKMIMCQKNIFDTSLRYARDRMILVRLL